MTAFVTSTAVSVLFVRSDSCYVELVADIYDIERDARSFTGSNPVVVHPPCRGWGRLSHRAVPREDERDLALFAVACVRRCGGVLEHPHASKLWCVAGLPLPGVVDAWGGYTVLVDQGWWGHTAPKPTWIYVCGVARSSLPSMPVQARRAAGRVVDLSRADRERTPVAFARWLLAVAAVAVTPTWRAVTPSWCRVGRRGSYSELADVVIG